MDDDEGSVDESIGEDFNQELDESMGSEDEN